MSSYSKSKKQSLEKYKTLQKICELFCIWGTQDLSENVMLWVSRLKKMNNFAVT